MFDEQSFRDAAAQYDRVALDAAVTELLRDPSRTPLPVLEGILETLQKKRQYELLVKLADGFVQAGIQSSKVRRRLAQALIEQGNLTGALALLADVLASAPDDAESGEACGLIGRVHKQQYVDGGRLSPSARRMSLEAAIRAYDDFYRQAPSKRTWHGINAVALAARAARDGVALSVQVDVPGVAREILTTLAATPDSQRPHWDFATEGEAQLALGEYDSALLCFARFIANAGADAFEIASPLRQLQEVWQLDETDVGAPLIALLRSALIARQGSRFAMRPGELESAQRLAPRNKETLERVLGKACPMPLADLDKWIARGRARASSVARIELRSGRGIGTGFLVPGRVFFPNEPALAKEYVLLTNAHVIGDDDPDTTPFAEACVRFEALPGQKQTFAIRQVLWRSPPHLLDTTIVRLDAALTGVDEYPLASNQEPRFDPVKANLYYLIGYPAGGPLAVSFEDNLQVGWKRPKLHYRTPTEPGSSGSPVFDHDWQLIAIHRAETSRRLDGGAGDYLANEGVWIHEIISQTKTVVLKLEGATPSTQPDFRTRVFVSYSHRDREWLDELKIALKPLGTELDSWDDTRIDPGQVWEREIEKALAGASVAILLVSKNFLASDFIMRKEFVALLDANKTRGMSLLWIPVGASLYEHTPLVSLQAALDPKAPLSSLTKGDQEAAFVTIGKKVAQLTKVGRLCNAFKVLDVRASELDSGAETPPSVVAKQEGTKIVFERAGRVELELDVEQLEQLDPANQALLEAHADSMVKLFTQFTRRWPERFTGDSEARKATAVELKRIRENLCREFGLFVAFLASIHVGLSDHYLHVRQVCGWGYDRLLDDLERSVSQA